MPPPLPLLERASRLLALAGGALTLGVSALVTASVLSRWATSQGVNGDFELVQVALAVSVFAFLPFCQARRGNVMVDTFTAWLPDGARRALDALWDVVYAGFSAFIAWRLVIGASDAFTNRTTSMVLGLPQHYAIAACAGMALFLALVAATTALARLRGDAP